jgi:hypothetical protein
MTTYYLSNPEQFERALSFADDVHHFGEHGLSVEQFASLAKFTSLRGLTFRSDATREAFASLLAQHPRLERLVFSGFPSLTDGDLEALAKLPLRYLGLGPVGAYTGDFFASLESLEALQLTKTTLPSAKGWAGLRSVRALHLVNCELTANDFEHIAALPALEHLRITTWEGTIPNHALVPLRKAPRLRHAFLKMRPLSRAEAEALVANPSLRTLVACIDDAKQLDGVTALGAFRGTLGLSLVPRHQLSDAVLEQLPMLVPSVQALDFDQNQVVGLCKKVSPNGLRELGKLKALRWLNLRGTYISKLTNEDLSFLPSLPELEALSVGAVGKVTAKLFDTLAQVSKLRSLDVSWIPVSDAAVKKLAGLPLESLFFYDAPLTDKGFANIAQLSTLERLSIKLAKGSLSDKGIASLASLHRLRHLRISSFTSAMSQTSFAPLTKIPALETFEYGVNEVSPLPETWLRSLLSSSSLRAIVFQNLIAPECTPELTTELLAAPALRLIAAQNWLVTPEARARIEAAKRPDLVEYRWPEHQHLQPPIRRFGDEEHLPFDSE